MLKAVALLAMAFVPFDGVAAGDEESTTLPAYEYTPLTQEEADSILPPELLENAQAAVNPADTIDPEMRPISA